MIAEFLLWGVLIVSVYILKIYFDKKEENNIDLLKQSLFEIVAKKKKELDKEGYIQECHSVATMAISRVVEVIDSLYIKDKKSYSQELIKRLNQFMDTYEGENELECEVSNGRGYAGSVVNDIIVYLNNISTTL